jgi:hypothetical protein
MVNIKKISKGVQTAHLIFFLFATILLSDIDLERFQKEESSGLCWQNAADVLAALRAGDTRCCIQLPIFEEFVMKMTAKA